MSLSEPDQQAEVGNLDDIRAKRATNGFSIPLLDAQGASKGVAGMVGKTMPATPLEAPCASSRGMLKPLVARFARMSSRFDPAQTGSSLRISCSPESTTAALRIALRP
jgi:hypothetical protein